MSGGAGGDDAPPTRFSVLQSRDDALAFLRGPSGSVNQNSSAANRGDSSSEEDAGPRPPPGQQGHDQHLEHQRHGRSDEGDFGNGGEQDEDDFVPPPPPGFGEDSDSSSDDDCGPRPDESGPARTSALAELPLARRVDISAGRGMTAPIQVLSLDPSGSLLVTSSGGGTRGFEFQRCNESLRPTATLTAADGFAPRLRAVAISARAFRGDDDREGEPLVLASDGTERPIVSPRSLFATGRLDKADGKVVKFKAGDRYAHDLRNTRGHVSPVTCCAWDDPRSATRALTGSLDGTVREWDLSRAEKGSVSLMRVSAARQMTNQVTAIRVFNRNALFGTSGGQLLLFDPRSPARAQAKIAGAHTSGGAITSIDSFSHYVCSRSASDSTVKVWDARVSLGSSSSASTAEPLHAWPGLPCACDASDAVFGPTGTVIAVCTGAVRSGGSRSIGDEKSEKGGNDGPQSLFPGALVFFDLRNGSLGPRAVPMPGGHSASRVAWHHVTGEIYAGLGDGSVSCFVDSVASGSAVRGGAVPKRGNSGVRGALGRVASRAMEDADGDGFAGEVITPNGLPAFNTGPQGRKRERLGQQMQGKGGNKGAAGGAAAASGAEKKGASSEGSGFAGITKDTVHHALNMDIVRKGFDWKMDPREAILRHATGDGPNQFITGYEETQPERILAEDPGEDGDQQVEVTKKAKLG